MARHCLTVYVCEPEISTDTYIATTQCVKKSQVILCMQFNAMLKVPGGEYASRREELRLPGNTYNEMRGEGTAT